jgi:peptidyl-prolyl cis-trans isomerase SurA
MKRRFLLLPLFAIALASTLASPSPVLAQAHGKAKLLDRVLVVVNDGVITESELAARVAEVKRQLAARHIKPPARNVLQQQIMDRMILEKIELQQASKAGITVSDAQVDTAIQNLAQRNHLSVKRFYQAAKDEGLQRAALRRNIRQQIKIAQLIDREVRDKVTVSDNEVDSFLAEQKRQGGGGEQFNLSHIFIPVPESANEVTRARALGLIRAIRAKIREGASFEQMALSYSKGPAALQGGGLGWRGAGQLPNSLLKAVRKLKPGQLSPIIPGSNGYHLLRLNARRGGKQDNIVLQTHVRHILIRPSEIRTPQQAKAIAELLRRRILAGESFAKLAKSESDDPVSGSRGGDLGWVSPGQMVPEFEAAMDKLKPGKISQPVRTRYGYHLIEVLARRTKDVGKQRQRLEARQQILQRKTEERLQEWQRNLRDEAYVDVLASPGS